MKTLKQLGEREVIRRLARVLRTRPDVRTGIGDDVAVVQIEGSSYDLLLTTDAVIETRHFLSDTPAWKIGHKAIGRVLSDLASMGGEPLWTLIDLVAPPNLAMDRLEKIYRGADRLAEKYGLAIIGGDTCSGDQLALHVFAVGRVPAGSAILRSGARRGDLIYVTGTLGGSLAGKHLTFEPRLEEGLWLREARWANAMIDLSDGLATDLRHILDMSGMGAEIEAEAIPISREARAARTKRTPLEHALFDGEDFELLFTVSANKQKAFESSWQDSFKLPCTNIGVITGRRRQVVLRAADGIRHPLPDRGFEHFKSIKKT